MALPLQWIGTFDFDALQFKDEGEVFYFPRDDSCDVSVLAQAGVCCVCGVGGMQRALSSTCPAGCNNSNLGRGAAGMLHGSACTRSTCPGSSLLIACVRAVTAARTILVLLLPPPRCCPCRVNR